MNLRSAAAAPLALAVLALSFPVALVTWAVTASFDPDRTAVSRSMAALGRLIVRASPLWRVTVEGALPPPPAPFVAVPNHRSMVDALAVAWLPRDLKWIGKREVFRLPWLGWAFRLAGYVPVLRGDRESGAAALGRLRGYLARGLPVGLFPEGTRSREGELRPFKAGPFKLAIEAGAPIVPVAIAGAGAAMPPDTAWLRPSHIRVRILPAVPTAGLTAGDVDRLRGEVRARIEAALAEMEA
ncbi:MAG TPA: lysophospholipid acyltransferase family protein [Anaeromyxobacteraceae bacterium]|nr:lysophospholipid acyltransferase family protein [Anaeromyxobacteraceae bacterium]